jgi:hypothetical protein
MVFWRGIMSNFDHYGAARELITYLLDDGYNDEAEALTSAMASGATGTEIFMAMRFHLSNIIRLIPLKDDAQIVASRLFAELNSALE